MIKLLYGDLYSYERLRFTGLHTEDILNLASKNNVIIKNAVRTEYAVIEADVYRLHIKKLKKLLGKNRYKITTLKRRGLSYKITANSKRIFLWLGMLFAIAGLFVLSLRVQSVKVFGYDDTEKIEGILKETGVLTWRKDALLMTQDVQSAINASDKDILWNSVFINGTVIEVYIKRDTNPKAEAIEEGNIVAKKDCVIRNLIVTGGTPAVENGQTVSEGQILIEASQKFGETVFPVNAQGKAIASVWYYASEDIPLENTVYRETGDSSAFFEINFFGMNISTCGENEFESFSEEAKEYDTFFLPIKIKKTVRKETKPVTEGIDREKCIREAETSLMNKLKLQIPEDAEIYETKTAVSEADGILNVSVYIETVENVAIRG